MAYEKGTYSKELEAEHENGEHDGDEHGQCPTCQRIRVEKDSVPITREQEMAFASQLQAEFDEAAEEHRKGWHKFDEMRPYLFKPNSSCEACMGVKPPKYW